MSHHDVIADALAARKLEGVPTKILRDLGKLNAAEFDKLGTPAVTPNGMGGYYCNCKDNGKHGPAFEGRSDCSRCGGYSY